MSDVLTTFLGLVKQTIGGNRNTWGGILNANFDLLEGALYGKTSKVVTGGSYELTDAERRKRIQVFTGTLTEAQIIVVPNLVGHWTVRNATSGSFALSFKTTAGSAVAIPQGGNCDVWCDGADVIHVGLSTRLRDTQMQAPDGTQSVPGFGFKDEIASGWRRVSSNVLALVVNAVDRVRVEAAVFKVILGSSVEVISATDTGVTTNVPLAVPSLSVGGVSGGTMPVGASTSFDGISEPNGWKWCNGQTLSRTTYASLLAALSATATATRANGSTTLSDVSEDLTGLGLEGAPIEGTGLGSSNTIVSLTSTTITLANAASGSGSISIRVLPHGAGDGSTTFNVPDKRGYADVGRDNMGGTSANRLTGQTGGLNGDRLGLAGGSETHTLTEAQLAAHDHTGSTNTTGAHTHNFTVYTGTQTSFNDTQSGSGAQRLAPSSGGNAFSIASGGSHSHTLTINNAGGDAAHNNVQPSRVTNKIIFTGVFA